MAQFKGHGQAGLVQKVAAEQTVRGLAVQYLRPALRPEMAACLQYSQSFRKASGEGGWEWGVTPCWPTDHCKHLCFLQ